MGTRSVIGVMHGDVVKAVYCHWDGYLSHNGKILLENYDSPKANNLVALGSISSLGPLIGEKHPFSEFDLEKEDPEYDKKVAQIKKAKELGWTTFYGRDREEEGQEFTSCFSDKEMYEQFPWCEYFYIMKDGVWYVSEGEGTEWEVLAKALTKEEA